jgi:hypothetical protein
MVDRAIMVLRGRDPLRSLSEASISRMARRYADNLQICSCAACGNPRKWTGQPTIPERINLPMDH